MFIKFVKVIFHPFSRDSLIFKIRDIHFEIELKYSKQISINIPFASFWKSSVLPKKFSMKTNIFHICSCLWIVINRFGSKIVTTVSKLFNSEWIPSLEMVRLFNLVLGFPDCPLTVVFLISRKSIYSKTHLLLS